MQIDRNVEDDIEVDYQSETSTITLDDSTEERSDKSEEVLLLFTSYEVICV